MSAGNTLPLRTIENQDRVTREIRDHLRAIRDLADQIVVGEPIDLDVEETAVEIRRLARRALECR